MYVDYFKCYYIWGVSDTVCRDQSSAKWVPVTLFKRISQKLLCLLQMMHNLYKSSRDVKPRGLASALRPKNLASASASWVVASASASWVLASASWVLASSLEAFRGQQPKRNGMWLELVNHHEFPEVSHAAAICKLVLHLAWKHSFIILNTRQPNL